jgi:hypothetical protein
MSSFLASQSSIRRHFLTFSLLLLALFSPCLFVLSQVGVLIAPLLLDLLQFLQLGSLSILFFDLARKLNLQFQKLDLA